MAREKLSSIPTIGVFIGIFGNYQDALSRGIAQAATENGCNVMFFAGAALDDGIGYRKHWNYLYSLAGRNNLDGLIVYTAAIKEFVTAKQLDQFFASYDSLPIISVNQKLDSVPSLTIDSAGGLRDMMQHLIEVHGYRRIAFIRGPENFDEAENRYRAYREGLEKYGIPFDPDLVVSGNFMPEAGIGAVRLLIDERKVSFDAIMAANDGMAFGAWKELHQRGIDVPKNVGLVGFDDVVEARSFAVPLTTISTSLFEQGKTAAEALIAHLREKTPLESITVPTSLVVRASCGCLSINAGSGGGVAGLPVTMDAERQSLIVQTVQNLICPVLPKATPEALEQLIMTFFERAAGQTFSPFLTGFSQLLQVSSANLSRAQVEDGAVLKWLDVLAILRENAESVVSADALGAAHTALYQAQTMVSQTIDRSHADLRSWAEADLRIQSEMIRDINTASEVEEITQLLADNLPAIGVRTCAVVLYEAETLPLMSRLVMACQDGRRIDLGTNGRLFSSSDILPREGLPFRASPLMVLLPLVSRDVRYGYMLMELIPGHWSLYNAYLALAEQISAALHGVLLQQQIKRTNEQLQKHTIGLAEANVQLEKARQEAEQANMVKSSFLAAMSHELRTPLNGIVNFTRFVADGMLGEINQRQADALQKAVLNSKHLLALINDVLDISKIESGSLKLFVEDIDDIDMELKEVVLTGVTLLEDKPVQLLMDFEADLPVLRGDRRRIKQIILNILSNACKFTDQGSIVLGARRDGQDLLITVKDTGVGIADEDQESVFEAFRQTEAGIRMGGGTGLGMPISRRLAEAHEGSLWLESALGKGTTVYIRLPIQSPALTLTLKEGKENAKLRVK